MPKQKGNKAREQQSKSGILGEPCRGHDKEIIGTIRTRDKFLRANQLD